MANVLNMEVNTVMVEEGPAYGAAILAAVADGRYQSVSQAVSAIVKRKETISPDSELVEKYNQGYKKYKELYPALKKFMRHL